MNYSKNINKYFEKLQTNSDYKKTNQLMGCEYSLLDKHNKNEILRFFIDDNLQVCIHRAKYTSKKTYLYEYLDNSDLLIIGFCLKGKAQINYKGKNTISKSQALYFRPEENFSIETLNHDFLYYIIDLNNFKRSLYKKNVKRKILCFVIPM